MVNVYMESILANHLAKKEIFEVLFHKYLVRDIILCALI
jgi:hypothetical protein